MTEPGWSRRAVLAGLAAAPAWEALAQGPPAAPRSLAEGALAGNALARSFKMAPAGLRLPELTLAGRKGTRRLSELRGRAFLIPLWAEWCAPCIVEMPDFAALQAKHGSARFQITPILTASSRKLNPAGAAQILAKVKAARFEPLVEPDGGRVLYSSLTTGGAFTARPTLPCNLLVDGRGRVVARQFGGMVTTRVTGLPAEMKPPTPGTTVSKSFVLTEAQKKKMMADAMAGGSRTIWSTPDADAFIAEVAGGLLDRL